MDFAAARKAIDEQAVAMLADKAAGIEAVAIGSKNGGRLSGATDFCVTAFVEKKLKQSELSARNLRPFDRVFAAAAASAGAPPPAQMDMDVVEAGGRFTALSKFSAPISQRGRYGGNPPSLNAQKWFDSVRAGIGITNPTNEYDTGRLSVGTLGFLVRDNQERLYLVSNNHVIGRENAAANGEMVVQPGTLDLTGLELSLLPREADLRAQLQIARVSGVVQLLFPSAAGTPHNQVDGAIAEVDLQSGRTLDDVDRITFSGRILGVAPPYRVDASGNLVGSDRVYKVGRTTGYTEGEVTNIAGVVAVPYGPGTATFTDQIFISATPDNVGPFSDGGDSGSAICNDDHQLVGLLFAGSPNRTIANPIHEVLSQLEAAAGIAGLRVA